MHYIAWKSFLTSASEKRPNPMLGKYMRFELNRTAMPICFPDNYSAFRLFFYFSSLEYCLDARMPTAQSVSPVRKSVGSVLKRENLLGESGSFAGIAWSSSCAIFGCGILSRYT